MNTAEKRDYIHSYLNRLMDKDIDDMFERVRSLVEKEITLTQEQENEVERRAIRHKKGESKSYSWPELKERVRPRS